MFNSTVLIIVLLMLVSCKNNIQVPADILYINADIITMNDEAPFAEAVAIKDGFIFKVGKKQNLYKFKGPKTKVVDLAGKILLPGFIDAHSHFSGVGTQAIVANLLPEPDGPVNSISDLQEALRVFMKKSPIFKRYNIVIGFNYDDSQLKEKRHPNRHDLDAVSTELPIVIMHQSGHLGVYNSKALAMMGIDATTKDPPGGIIEREVDGKTPSGVMQENAHFMIFFKLIPDFSDKDLVALYKAGEFSYVSNGFTTVQEGKTDIATLKVLPKIAKNEGFDIDIIAYPDLKTLYGTPMIKNLQVTESYQHRIRIGGMKITFDGSPQGKTAWFTKPYLEVPAGQSKNYAGYPALTDQEAYKLMQYAYKRKWPLLVHTNGDAAIDQLIRLVSKAKKDYSLGDHRTVMIHGQFTRKDQVEPLKKLGVFPALYPMHTFYWGDWHRDSVAGIERAKHISPTGWMLAHNIKFTIHSDAPVTFPNSMRILDSAVNRSTRSGKILGKEHQLNPLQALKAMTIWAAYQHFEESIKGSIEKGKQADFVVLDQNPMKVSKEKIKDIQVLQTINDGKTIYLRES